MLSSNQSSNQVGEVPPTVLVNSFIFNRDFRREVHQTLKSFGREAVLNWLTEEVKIDQTEADVLVKSIMKKEAGSQNMEFASQIHELKSNLNLGETWRRMVDLLRSNS